VRSWDINSGQRLLQKQYRCRNKHLWRLFSVAQLQIEIGGARALEEEVLERVTRNQEWKVWGD